MIIIKPSFVIAATVAALAISVWTGRKRRHERDPPGDAEQIRVLAMELRKRKTAIEKRLLELCEAREEYRLIIRLRRRLSEKCSEVESLDGEVRKLWAERDALEEELRKSADGAEELRSARGVIMGLQERIDSRNKELNAVEERVDAVWRNNVRCDEGLGVGYKEKDATSDLKIEVLELQRTNKELKLETRELALKLDAAWARIAELLNRIENKHEIIAEFKKEAALLRQGYEDLQKRVDQLQKQRFDTVEELVYMRWLNICLRFEAEESYETSQRNPTDSPHCNYRREWNAEYVDKTRRILTAVSRGSDSSRTSMEESRELVTSSTESTASSSYKNEKSHSLIHRMKHWGRGRKSRNGNPRSMSEENASEGGRRIRRFSMSMVPDPRATTESHDAKKGLSRLRRVSFNDALGASEPLFGNNATSPGTTEVAKGPDSGTRGTTNPEHQNISARSDVGGSISHAEYKQNREQEDARAAAEVGTADVVVTVTGICETCLAVAFLVLVLILTLYYRIF